MNVILYLQYCNLNNIFENRTVITDNSKYSCSHQNSLVTTTHLTYNSKLRLKDIFFCNVAVYTLDRLLVALSSIGLGIKQKRLCSIRCIMNHLAMFC